MLHSVLLRLFIVTLLLANAFGVSFSRNAYSTHFPIAVATADIDKDGYADLIIADGDKYLAIYRGTSGGKFVFNVTVPTQQQPVGIVAGDFDNDGYPDVAVLEQNQFELFVSTHIGSLAFRDSQEFGNVGSAHGMDIAVADLTGDKIPDLILTAKISGATPSQFMRTLWNDGHGVFTDGQQVQLASASIGKNGLAIADFNRDGRDDIAVADGPVVRVLKTRTSNGNGQVDAYKSFTPVSGTPSPIDIAAGPINTTGGADIVVVAADTCGPSCSNHANAFVYLNSGSGSFNWKSTVNLGNEAIGKVILADVTGDNRLDIVHANEGTVNGVVSYARSKGDGTFYSRVQVADLYAPVDLLSRDFNRDSRHDLAIADASAGVTYVETNTDAAAICAPPSSASFQVKICTPSTTTGTAFYVRASANSPVAIKRIELWVDGSKRYDSPDDQLYRYVSLSSGSHKITVVAVSQFGATVKSTRNVTVQ